MMSPTSTVRRHQRSPLFSLANISVTVQLWIQVFWVISVQFDLRNTLPKSGPFLLLHSVYCNREDCVNFYVEYSTCFIKFLVRCVNQIYEIFKEPLNVLTFTNIILLYINHQHFSGTLVFIFRVMGTNTQTQSYCV